MVMAPTAIAITAIRAMVMAIMATRVTTIVAITIVPIMVVAITIVATTIIAIRVVAITGAGRAFCAGADIHVMNNASLSDFRNFLALLTDVWAFIRTFPKPTIAVINGVAVGGGFELVLICDFRIASESARLGSAEVRINQPMTNGSTYLLSRLIGEGRAKQLGMTGEIIDAETSERIGLVNAVVEPDVLPAHETLHRDELKLVIDQDLPAPVDLEDAARGHGAAYRSGI